jgi:large subunit ribosomal protein L40
VGDLLFFPSTSTAAHTMRRLPISSFRSTSRLLPTEAQFHVPENRRMASGNAWSKSKAKKPAETTSSNPFLMGLNFNSDTSNIRMARGILFSQKPLRGLRLNPQDQIRHETILRAWNLFRSKQRRERMGRLSRLQASVAETLKVLKETDETLYAQAVSGAREEEKRFPLVMRIPTNSMPTRWWNYSWTSRNIVGTGGVSKPE